MNLRDKSLACLKDVSALLIKENNNKITSEIKSALTNIKISMTNIVSHLRKLRKRTQLGIIKGKFNLERMKYGYILDSFFVVKLNNDLQFIRDGPIGRLFNLSDDFDPLMIDFKEKNNSCTIDKKTLIDNSYTLFNEMIYNNLIFNRSLAKLSSSTIQLKVLAQNTSRMRMTGTSITNNMSALNYSVYNPRDRRDESNKRRNDTRNRTKEDFKSKTNDKETILCRSKEQVNGDKTLIGFNNDNSDLNIPAMKDDDIINDQESKCLSKVKNGTGRNERNSGIKPVMNFFTGKIDDFVHIYNDYLKSISNKQRELFKIENNITSYFTEGINPLIVTHYNNKGDNSTLTSLCVITTDPDNSSLLLIKHLSCFVDFDLNYIVTELIPFIQSNIPYKELAINLYYNDTSSAKNNELEGDINLIFKNLNFQWMKMDIPDNKKKFQTIRCKNNNEIMTVSGKNNSPTGLEIKSGVIAWVRTTNLNDHFTEENVNKANALNKQMIYSLINKTSQIEEIKEALRYLEVFEGIEEETIKFLIAKGFNKEDFMPLVIESKQQTYLSCFKLLPLFKTISTKKINNYLYNRLIATYNILLDEETNQTFYQLYQSHFHILIGEKTPRISQQLSNCDNICEAFSSLYSEMKTVQNNIRSAVWLPAFSIYDKASCLHESDSAIALSSFSSATFPYCQYYFNTITNEKKDNDIFISNAFIFAIVSLNTKLSTSNQIVFCSVVNQSDWKGEDKL